MSSRSPLRRSPPLEAGLRAACAIVFAVLAGLAALLLSGCEEEVNPVLGIDRAFSIYGVFSPQLDTQRVLVFPMEGRIQPRAQEPLDARVTSTDLHTGEVRVWHDSLVADSRGLFEHVFWSPFRAEYEHGYRIEVRRSDEATSSAQTEVPAESVLILQEPVIPRPPEHVELPVLIQGDVPRLIRIEVTYQIQFAEGDPALTTLTHTIPYNGEQQQVPGGWSFPIDLTRDHDILRSMAAEMDYWDPIHGVILLDMVLRLIAASEDWNPPGHTFDPNVLVEPGTMSNVVNGFGFIGAGYRLERQWRPPEAALQAAGFRPSMD